MPSLSTIPRPTFDPRLTAWGSPTTGARAGRYAVGVVLLAGAYYGAAKLGLKLAYLDGAVTALWPPVGVGMAALVLFGPRLWPGVVLGDLLVADFSTPMGTVMGQTAGNTLEVLVGALLLRRLAGADVAMHRVRDVFALVAAAAAGTLISACFGTASLRLGDVVGAHETVEVWRTWWLSDFSGALVVTPAILAWAHGSPRRPTRRTLLEGAALLVALVLLAEVPSQRDVPYVVFPTLIWAALRFGPPGASAAVLIAASLTVWNTAQNAGPFVRASITDSLLSTQLFLSTAALTSLILAALTAERKRADEALHQDVLVRRRAEQRLVASERSTRRLADEQAALRRIATLVAAEAAPSAVFERVTTEVGQLLSVPDARVVRYEDTGFGTIVGGWAADPDVEAWPVGASVPLDSDTVIVRVLRTGEAQRVTTYEGVGGELAERLRTVGFGAAVAAPVRVGGRVWGVLVAAAHDPDDLPEGAEGRLSAFAELVAQALANADAYEKLAASRTRIVEAGDAERRRLERNLHDGAQQRLVTLAVSLRLVEARLAADPEATRRMLADAQQQLADALLELRELARGIHPAVLTDRGLGAAVGALASRSPVPLEVIDVPEERLPSPVEAAAYYIVAEAVTNVAKYAGASLVTVAVRPDGDRMVVEVADDGVGGADPASGTGLRGIADRVEALHGRLEISSPAGSGTRLTAEIPLDGHG
ncbi:MAG TPA: MASE1 domain-containing protein [Baekduia sp.]|nr:MASE1 domain-containing protein [Baekduia sp.]